MKKRIKIGIFVDGDFIPSYDGASNRFHYLSRFLSKSGKIDVVIFHGYRQWSDVSLIKKEGFKTYILPIDTYYNNLELLAHLIKKERIDIIQFDNLEPVLLQGIRLASLTGVRLVSEMHYVVRDLAKRLGADSKRIREIKINEEIVGKNIDHTICLSSDDVPKLTDDMKIDKKRISVIPSGVDCNEIKYFGPNLKERNIIFLGNLFFKPNEDAVRNIHKFIYPELKKNGFRFTIVGDCPIFLKEEFESGDFTFIGTIPNLSDVFSKATFALSPVNEGTGMRIKILNYLAAGIPVITTGIATAGFKHKDVLFVADNLSSYSDIVLKLINDADFLKSKALIGRKVIEREYNWEVIANKTIDVYKRILRSKEVKKEISVVLKNKEPIWLQEAMKKKRFKEIASRDLPKEYSFCLIDKKKILSYKIEKIIALEGMPGAGKTTFINNRKKIEKRKELYIPQLEIKNEDILKRDDIKTSETFLLAEIDKSKFINRSSQLYKKIILDRTFLTTLAYCYARSKISNRISDYYRLLKLYKKIKHNIYFPTHIIFFDVKISSSLRRRNVYSKEKLYHYWFNPAFLKYFRDFYRKEVNKISPVRLNYINTSNMKADEVFRKINDII